MSGAPLSKAEQLARGPKRPARVKASREEWLALRRAKLERCRLYSPHVCQGISELHHLQSRAQGGGDVADNLVSLCRRHHRLITENDADTKMALAQNLSDAEYTHLIEQLGEGALERLFGVLGR